MLITLTENAIKHGIEPSSEGGRVTVTAARTTAGGRPALALTVADTGVGPGPGRSAVPGQGIGLANVRERLALLYDGAATLDVAANLPQGFVARIVLPLSASPLPTKASE
jgi:sensor histidine kinase YesM